VIGATIELPLGAACPRSVSNVPLSLDTAGLSDGEHVLRVWVTDAAGNTTTLVDQPIASGRSTMTVHDGKLRAILAYHNSRTIIFRYNPHNGEYAQVKIPIHITH
jgi:hypothetical protein